MIDLVALHKMLKCEKNMGNFIASKPYKMCVDSLHRRGLTMNQISVHVSPCKNVASKRAVHPVLALEYLRWADYERYIGQLTKLVERDEKPANSE